MDTVGTRQCGGGEDRWDESPNRTRASPNQEVNAKYKCEMCVYGLYRYRVGIQEDYTNDRLFSANASHMQDETVWVCDYEDIKTTCRRLRPVLSGTPLPPLCDGYRPW